MGAEEVVAAISLYQWQMRIGRSVELKESGYHKCRLKEKRQDPCLTSQKPKAKIAANRVYAKEYGRRLNQGMTGNQRITQNADGRINGIKVC